MKTERHSKAISEVVRQLYRGGREWSADVFQARALSLLRSVCPFDSALWATASCETREIHPAYLENQSPDMLDAYKYFCYEDPLWRQAIANPGVTVNLRDLESEGIFEPSPFFKGFTTYYKLGPNLTTALGQRAIPLFDFVSLWRKNPRRQFSEKDRWSKEFLMPHLIESHHFNRLHAVRESDGKTGERRAAAAVCDRRGLTHQADDRFILLLRREWPNWNVTQLPEELCACITSGKSRFTGKKIYIDIHLLDNLISLYGRKRTEIDRLGERERLVAESYAAGNTYSEIADSLSVAPSTVRRQIETVYKKLAVTNKVQLVHVLANA